MEVIDTLVHLNEGGVEGALNTMDAVGVDAVVLDEWTGVDPLIGASRPFRRLPNGAIRWEYPFSREATRLHPGRFKYNVKIDRNDPDWRELLIEASEDPHKISLRISPGKNGADVGSLAAGEYDGLLGLAQECRVPVTLYTSGNLQALDRVARTFPELKIMLNHCGMLPLSAGGSIDAEFPFRPVVEAAADKPNVHVQLCFAPWLSKQAWPFADLQPHYRRLIGAFGPERLIWGSSHPIATNDYSWAQDLSYLQLPGLLSDTEKDWIFAGSARAFYGWPKTVTAGRYRTRG